ncbi:MAG: acyl-CoA thioesterase [Desulfovibrio sp.]|jgi:acyl-CoA thioester hydrolase|nr:acyl-CoA thioesterase [Desulfovibrio sp.]
MTDTIGPDVWMQHRVSYGETDTMGVLYYAEYLHIFERGRNAFIRAFGFSYNDVEKRGVYLPVREAGCRYRSSARYDDLLNLRCGISEWRRASFTFHYDIFDESKGRLIAQGFTQHALVNNQGKPLPVPDWFRDSFRSLPSGSGI